VIAQRRSRLLYAGGSFIYNLTPFCKQVHLEESALEMTPSTPIRVLCIDDHPVIRHGVGSAIGRESDMVLVAAGSGSRDAVELFRTHRPDVMLLDLRLPENSGLNTLIQIREEFPDARVIILTTSEGDVEIRRAFAAGARAYVLKSTPPHELLGIIRQVHVGKKRIPPAIATQLAQHSTDEMLTGREIEVLRRVAEGHSNREIAVNLAITEETVKVRIKHIMEKLGARDRTQAVAIGARRGIIDL
jgi:DNA-binding NarL/FixJ family response regulator